MKLIAGERQIIKRLDLSAPKFLLCIAIAFACAVAGVIEVTSRSFGIYPYLVGLGLFAIFIILILRQNELAVTCVLATQVIVDWYINLHVVSVVLAAVLLSIFFLARSPKYPWIEPHALWLWALYLILTVYPAIHGALTLYDAGFYYPNIVFGAFVMCWLGRVVIRNITSLRRLFDMIAILACLFALHTIIEAVTGKFLFSTSRNDLFLMQYSSFQFTGTNIARAGSFMQDPNWNGTFFAIMLFIPLGLFFESSSIWRKAVYAIEMLLILPALLYTYSNGAWIGVFAGMIAFIILVGQARHRLLILFLIACATVVLLTVFPTQISVQLQHAATPYELPLRLGAWTTAVNVILANPITGVGLGLQAYVQRAEPLRVSAQFVPLVQPHNAYLEIGAMAGIPVLLVFVSLLLYTFWLALQNWRVADIRSRALLSGGIGAVLALIINSISINGWTLPPLAVYGWLLLGALSSPLLKQSLEQKIHVEKTR